MQTGPAAPREKKLKTWNNRDVLSKVQMQQPMQYVENTVRGIRVSKPVVHWSFEVYEGV